MEALSQRRVIDRLHHARHFFAQHDEEYSHVRMCFENAIELRADAGVYYAVPHSDGEVEECLGFKIDTVVVMGPDRLEFYNLDEQRWIVSILLKGQIDYVRR